MSGDKAWLLAVGYEAQMMALEQMEADGTLDTDRVNPSRIREYVAFLEAERDELRAQLEHIEEYGTADLNEAARLREEMRRANPSESPNSSNEEEG